MRIRRFGFEKPYKTGFKGALTQGLQDFKNVAEVEVVSFNVFLQPTLERRVCFDDGLRVHFTALLTHWIQISVRVKTKKAALSSCLSLHGSAHQKQSTLLYVISEQRDSSNAAPVSSR